jgi:apolipoprotein D and lipocalin family protein
MKKHLIYFIMALFTFSGCSAKSATLDNTPIKELDLNKYLGTWYEIARFDHTFERGLDNVSAKYSLTENGMVKVENSGWKDGVYQSIIGKAKQPAPEKNPALLKVSFFWIFYSDYRILYLDEDYQNVLIGGSKSKYLWIMSRTPSPDKKTIDLLINEAKHRGYDTEKLIMVDQSKKK